MLFLRNIHHSVITLLFLFLCSLSVSSQAANKETFKPFVLAEQTNISMADAQEKVAQQIQQSPFTLVAEYSPYDDAHIYVITSDELKSLASEAQYGGFAAPQRISITLVNNQIQIAYTNPVYMQHIGWIFKAIDL
ncbi:hypothetical protein [sulfur-oxidizing endosymbiont of Gigantopelta aegis]|uniref:hypothetical protein n=1 Tax=sulfur-oxidizing endosymbiont of Gigantopelta aegis TaxID=2794934 RepID=UPI0018DC5A3D|nr:hypothetical protein [sulfur-oxidizing endosymbiont of Gigantopelta aegis]